MTSAGIRDLKDNLSRYLRQLKPGDSITVTDHGRAVAELRVPGPPAADRGRSALVDGYARLVAAGVVHLAAESGDPLADWPTEREVMLPPGTAMALIDEDRGP